MTRNNKRHKKKARYNPNLSTKGQRMMFPRVVKQGICLHTLASSFTGRLGVEARKLLFAGIERPEAGPGCFCWLCDKPYSPSRRPGRFLLFTYQLIGEPVGLSAICKPCLDEIETEGDLWRAIYSAAPR